MEVSEITTAGTGYAFTNTSATTADIYIKFTNSGQEKRAQATLKAAGIKSDDLTTHFTMTDGAPILQQSKDNLLDTSSFSV